MAGSHQGAVYLGPRHEAKAVLALPVSRTMHLTNKTQTHPLSMFGEAPSWLPSPCMPSTCSGLAWGPIPSLLGLAQHPGSAANFGHGCGASNGFARVARQLRWLHNAHAGN